MALDYLLSPKTLSQFPGSEKRITVYPSRPASIARLVRLGVNVVSPDDPVYKAEAAGQRAFIVEKKGRDAGRYRHVLRDALMTGKSDYDILYARSDDEARAMYGARWRPRVSGTEMNRRRREELGLRMGGGGGGSGGKGG